MAWRLVDDFTDEFIPDDAGHRLTLCLDGIEIRGYDVAAANPDDLVATLGEHLSGIAAPLDSPRSGASDNAEVVDEQHVHDRRWLNSQVWADAIDGVGDEDGTEGSEPAPESPSDEQVAAELGETAPSGSPSTAVGEATSGRASDATVRAWCAKWGVPHSRHGRLNDSAREAYERAYGGEPDDETVRADSPATTNGHVLPAEPERTATDEDVSGAAAPAVESIAQPRTHAQLLDQAEALLAQKKTPAQVARETGLSVEEVRDLLPRPGSRRR